MKTFLEQLKDKRSLLQANILRLQNLVTAIDLLILTEDPSKPDASIVQEQMSPQVPHRYELPSQTKVGAETTNKPTKRQGRTKEFKPRACVNPTCGITYTPTGTKQRYHSSACRIAHEGSTVDVAKTSWPEEEMAKFSRWATTYAAGSYVEKHFWPQVREFCDDVVAEICKEYACQRGVSASQYVGDVFITRLKKFVNNLNSTPRVDVRV